MTLRKFPQGFYWATDCAAFGTAFLCAYGLVPVLQRVTAPGGLFFADFYTRRFSVTGEFGHLPPMHELVWIYFLESLVAIPVLSAFGCYDFSFNRPRVRLIVGCFAAATAGIGLVSLVLLAFKSWEWSRLFIFAFALIGGVLISSYRLVIRSYFERRREAGHYARNVVLIGRRIALKWMTSYFAENISKAEYKLFGYLLQELSAADMTSDRTATRQSEAVSNNLGTSELPCWGSVDDLGGLLISKPVHEVILIDAGYQRETIERIVKDCDYLGTVLRIVPESLLAKGNTLRFLYHEAALNLPAIVLVPPHWDSEAQFFKRLFDIVASAMLLIVLLPVFLVIGVAIKITTSQLPVFYPWRVVGKNGVEFTGYKFTTMIIDADSRKRDLMNQNEMSGPVFKIKDDPRVTRLGKFLRKFSFNELPQLWSVLKGDMSLVGPRPAFPHELARYEFWHKRKLSIRPGITCFWQIRGRNKISNFDDWVKMDLEYIDKWTFWLDFKILFRTVWVILAGTGS